MRGVKDSCYFDADHLPLKELCTSRELMRFAIESAQGMEYLSMKKVDNATLCDIEFVAVRHWQQMLVVYP